MTRLRRLCSWLWWAPAWCYIRYLTWIVLPFGTFVVAHPGLLWRPWRRW